MKKIETLRYFPLTDSMAPSLAVLVIPYSSPNRLFSIFAHFGAQTPERISETGDPSLPNLRHDRTIICAESVCYGVPKNCAVFEWSPSNRDWGRKIGSKFFAF